MPTAAAPPTVVLMVMWSDWGAPLDGALRSIATALAASIARCGAGGDDKTFVQKGTQVVAQKDVADLTLHRTIKFVANAVRKAWATPQSEAATADLLLIAVLLPVFACVETRRSLFKALIALRHDEGIAVAIGQVALAPPAALVGGGPVPALLIPWLEGHEVACDLWSAAAETKVHPSPASMTLVCPPRTATASAPPPPSIVDGADFTVASSQWVTSAAQWKHALPSLPDADDGSAAGRRQCMFVGVCEAAVAVPSTAARDMEAATSTCPMLALDVRVRRWLCEWCCQPNRIVCFVQAGGAASGERYPLGMLHRWMASLEGATSGGAMPALPVPMAHFFSYVCIDDAVDGGRVPAQCAAVVTGSNSGSHLAAAPVPLTLSGLSFLATALHVSISQSLMIAHAPSAAFPWTSLVPELPVVDVADEASVLQRMRQLSSVTPANGACGASPVGECHPHPPLQPPGSPSDGHHHNASGATVSFGHRLWADVRYCEPPQTTHSSSDASAAIANTPAPVYACNVDVLHALCDTKTAQVARRYVHENFLLSETVAIARYGVWGVLARARCLSSDRSQQYAVEVGTVRGRLVHACCTCASVSLTKLLCRHSAALCITLLGVQMDHLEDANAVAAPGVEAMGAADSSDAERIALDAEEAQSEGSVRDCERPKSTYCPQPTEMTPTGLPAYMMQAATHSSSRKSSRRGEACTPPPHGRRSAALSSSIAGPNAPQGKRMTPFFFFSMQQRPALRTAQPELKPTEVARQLGLMWRALSDDARHDVAAACRLDGDKWDAEWAAYRTTDEYQEALAAAKLREVEAVGTDESMLHPKRRVDHGEVASEAVGDGNDGGCTGVPSADRFHALNPEWQRDAEGNWKCAWDDVSSESLAGAATDGRGVAVPPRPKLGSLAVGCFPAQGPGSGSRVGGLSRRGTSEMETRASLLRTEFLDE